jgi:hypothetical protein
VRFALLDLDNLVEIGLRITLPDLHFTLHNLVIRRVDILVDTASPCPAPGSPNEQVNPPQDQPFYQHFTGADYAPLISRLGPIGIASAIAILPREKN